MPVWFPDDELPEGTTFPRRKPGGDPPRPEPKPRDWPIEIRVPWHSARTRIGHCGIAVLKTTVRGTRLDVYTAARVIASDCQRLGLRRAGHSEQEAREIIALAHWHMLRLIAKQHGRPEPPHCPAECLKITTEARAEIGFFERKAELIVA